MHKIASDIDWLLLGKILHVTKLFFVLLSSINPLPWFSSWSKVTYVGKFKGGEDGCEGRLEVQYFT